ncbi:MAG: hypothetical protein H0X40_17135 [Chthoniobacterales bacterium]|nr:hypothetical protein [Chthoniobacterales bacterium]
MSFGHLPALVSDLTFGRATVEIEIVTADRTLDSLTLEDGETYWPSPDDTRPEIDELTRLGSYDSIFVFWPQNDFGSNGSIPARGWGLGMSASAWSNHATYATVANAPPFAWRIPKIGEVWLHEWLHGVCAYFRERGHLMPAGDADGGSRHGYVQSETKGWTDYYRDLMNAGVLDEGRLTGIRPDGWLLERPSPSEILPHA